jgi:hypothetical protein
LVDALLTSAARACDTPVYRYAMYRWLPAPYEVYCFHKSEINDAGLAVKNAIETVSEAEDNRANVVFLPVDLAKDPELKTVPPDVKRAWEADPQEELPSFLISSPLPPIDEDGMPVHVFSGKLTKEVMPALFNSPAREELASQLGQGKAGVFVFLPGAKKEANEKAEKVIRGVVDDVKSGKVQLYVSPAMAFAADDEDSENAPPATEVGFVKIDRSDKAEDWFVRCLLTLEPDLKKTEEPILFTVYGRGRALFSCLGEGIHPDNLVQDIEFITGACSCTVKEQNPGVDLLVQYDWEAAASNIAEKFGAEEGSRYHFSGDSLFPELIIPAGDGRDATVKDDTDIAAAVPAEEPAVDDADTQVAQADTATADAETTAAADVDVTAKSAESERQAADPDDASSDAANGAATQIASNTPADQVGQADGGGTTSIRGVLIVGVGLILTLVVLFAATLIVLRPK